MGTPSEYSSAVIRRRFKIVQMPSFLVLNIHRFKKNSFFWEKNSSIVNFPIKNFDTKDISPLSTQKTTTLYDLIATVSHEGSFEDGIYKTAGICSSKNRRHMVRNSR